MRAPNQPADFDRAYSAPITPWGDTRIPPELKALAKEGNPRRSLELGCGIGRFTRYLAQQGLEATGVDFSPVAIGKANQRAANEPNPPTYLVGDVTDLKMLTGPYDFSFDVGCYHCLEPDGERRYAAEVARLLKPGATHLIWSLDHSPSDLTLDDAAIRAVFGDAFELTRSESSRRRLIASHWFWLERR